MPRRIHEFVLIATFLPLCWLVMQAVHELGHVTTALATGGTVTKVVLHPLAISRTDISGSSHPALVVWAGPVFGVALPLALLAVCRAAKWRWTYLVRFFAGTCAIANGAYLGIGSFQGIGDAGDLIQQGSPVWSLWLFGMVAIPLGLGLWNGLGPNFGFGQAEGKVDRAVVLFSVVLLLVVIVLELALSPSH
jgi:hypothetical protein